jgi:hypothetical protein
MDRVFRRSAKSIRCILCTLIVGMYFSCMSNTMEAQVTGNVDPNVEQFQVIRGMGDPNYNGAVDVSIPLLTVPGIDGLNYDVTLKYISGNGVPISTSSSWVGLGWTLPNYEITCDPIHAGNGADGGQYYSYMGSDTTYIPDSYHLIYPGGTTPFWLDRSGNGIPINWSAIKIKAIKEANSKEIQYFVIYGVDGKKYVYANRLLKTTAEKLRNHDLIDGLRQFYYVYKLTAILAADYIDGGASWVTPGDLGTDKGGWIRLEYSDPEQIGTSGYDHHYDYLKAIKTPTHTAKFNLKESGGFQFIMNNQGFQGMNLPALETISLFVNNVVNPMKVVNFYQSAGFHWLYYNYTNGDRPVYLWETKSGIGLGARGRLDSVSIVSGNGISSQPSYKFDYYYNSNFKFNDGTPLFCIDNWGLIDTLSDIYKKYPNHSYMYGLLKSIGYPTGGSVLFEYEPNSFLPEPYSERNPMPDPTDPNSFPNPHPDPVMAGGFRLRKQTITDPQKGASQTYEYKYGLLPQDTTAEPVNSGYGYVSSDPGTTAPWRGTIYRLGNNFRSDVHYPLVTIVNPDGSKINKYFSSAITEFPSECSRMMLYFPDWPQIIFQNNTSWPQFSGYVSSVEPFPYCYQDYFRKKDGNYYSYQSNDRVYTCGTMYYGPINAYSTNAPIENLAWLVNIIASCEVAELDDCNSNFWGRIEYNYAPSGEQLPPSGIINLEGFIKTAGIDNTWKRGYLLKEEKRSSNGDLVWSKDYYYDMILKATQDYLVVFPNAKFSENLRSVADAILHFTECSGQVKLTKTEEKSY